MGRPGIMLYFDILEPIRELSDTERGQLLVAMLEYGQQGTLPRFQGMLAVAWGFIRPKLDRDNQEYNMSVLRRRFATACRERKRRGAPEITFEQWLKSSREGDDQWYPAAETTAEAAPYTDTDTALSAAAAPDPAAAADRKLKMLGGQIGKGVVLLSDAQIEDLLDRLGLEVFDHYVDKLSAFILEKGARVPSHYDTILKWWTADSAVEKEMR